MLRIKPLKIFVLLFAIENIMSKTYLIETTAEEENGKYYTNTRKVILIMIKQITLLLHAERPCKKPEAE